MTISAPPPSSAAGGGAVAEDPIGAGGAAGGASDFAWSRDASAEMTAMAGAVAAPVEPAPVAECWRCKRPIKAFAPPLELRAEASLAESDGTAVEQGGCGGSSTSAGGDGSAT